MEKYKGTESFSPSQHDFDFDFDLRLNGFDYLRLLPYALFLLPVILILEFFSKFSNKDKARTEHPDNRIKVLQNVQPESRIG